MDHTPPPSVLRFPDVPPPTDVLDRYVAGESVGTEETWVRDWIDADPTRQAHARALKTLDAGSADDTSEASESVDALWGALKARLHTEQGDQPTGRRDMTKPVSRRRSPSTRLIAGLGLALGIGAIALVSRPTGTRQPSPENLSARSYATTTGERATITLEDGSHVTLAPRTRLLVSAHFPAERTVTLIGAALFDVTQHGGSPFTVVTGHVATRVLGTTFSVQHYTDAAAVRVEVTSGKVMTANAHRAQVVTPGFTAMVTDSVMTTEPTARQNVQTDLEHGRLIFTKASVSTMLAEVGRWYGYDFRLADTTLNHEKINAVFNVATTTETMTAIRELLDVTMTFDGTVITLHPRRNAGTPAVRRSHTPPITPTEVGR